MGCVGYPRSLDLDARFEKDLIHDCALTTQRLCPEDLSDLHRLSEREDSSTKNFVPSGSPDGSLSKEIVGSGCPSLENVLCCAYMLRNKSFESDGFGAVPPAVLARQAAEQFGRCAAEY